MFFLFRNLRQHFIDFNQPDYWPTEFDPTWSVGFCNWQRVFLPETRCHWVDSGLGTNPTRIDSWTLLPKTHFFFFFLTKVHGLIIPSSLSLSLSLSPLKKMKITFFFKKKRERYHSDRATTTTVICKVWLWCLLDPRRLLCLSLNVATIYCWALSVSWMTKRKRRLVRENITVGSEFGNGDTYMVVDHWKSSSCERRAQNWRWVFNRFNP